uniref:Uncharacterized protein n=1 Tax=Babesia bovis TaxID=5865 RepID=S6BKE9_BABBO|nr:hypothetical protein [Babesia bovis]
MKHSSADFCLYFCSIGSISCPMSMHLLFLNATIDSVSFIPPFLSIFVRLSTSSLVSGGALHPSMKHPDSSNALIAIPKTEVCLMPMTGYSYVCLNTFVVLEYTYTLDASLRNGIHSADSCVSLMTHITLMRSVCSFPLTLTDIDPSDSLL